MGHTVPIRGKKEHTIPDLLYGLAIVHDDVGRFGEIRLRTFPYELRPLFATLFPGQQRVTYSSVDRCCLFVDTRLV